MDQKQKQQEAQARAKARGITGKYRTPEDRAKYLRGCKALAVRDELAEKQQ